MGDQENRRRRSTALRVRKFRAHKRFCQLQRMGTQSSTSTSGESILQNDEGNYN